MGVVFSDTLETLCIRERNYFCYLRYSCKKVFADLATYLGHTDLDIYVLFIGGGGYTIPRFLEVMFPRSNL